MKKQLDSSISGYKEEISQFQSSLIGFKAKSKQLVTEKMKFEREINVNNRKFAQSTNDFLKTKSIIAELENQLKSFQAQKSALESKINIISNNIELLNENLKKFEEKKSALDHDLSSAKEEMTKTKDQISRLQSELQRLETELTKNANKLVQTKELKRKNTEKMENLKTSKTQDLLCVIYYHLEKNSEEFRQLMQESDKLNHVIQELEVEISNLKTEKEEKSKNLESSAWNIGLGI